jgi:hemerythrin
MANDPAITWTDKFLLGYTPMDGIHREFVDLVGKANAAADDELPACFTAVAEHLERHFREEKEWMETTAFPHTGCHVDEHNAVLNSMSQVSALLAKDGNLAVARSILAELVRWFPGHADYMDSALAQWMVKRVHGGAPLVFCRNITSKEKQPA